MMTEFRDPMLETLFDEANRELEGERITASVMAGTRNRLLRMAVITVTSSLLVLLIAWYFFAMPLLEFAVLISQFFTNPIVDFGDGWLALALLPVNNLASISVLSTKLAMLAWKKLTGTSLVR